MSIKGVTMFFFKTPEVRKKTPTEILLSLQDKIINYNKKYIYTSNFHYRQKRASYLSDFLEEKIKVYTFNNKPEEKEILLKKILIELYVHYLSISQISIFSTLGRDIKDAITGLLNIKKNSSSSEIKKEMKRFTNSDLINIKRHARAISEEEEEIIPRLLNPPKVSRPSYGLLGAACREAHRAIDDLSILTPIKNKKPKNKINEFYETLSRYFLCR